MNRKWVEKQNGIKRTKLAKIEEEIREKLVECELLDEEDLQFVFEELNECAKYRMSFHFPTKLWDKYREFYKKHQPERRAEAFSAFYFKVDEIFKSLPMQDYVRTSIENYERFLDSDPVEFDGDLLITDPCYIMKPSEKDYSSIPSFWDYVTKSKTVIKDGKTFHYPPRHEDYPDCVDGESPTYKAEMDAYHAADEKWHEENIDDWERCGYGENMEVLGINNYMTRDTIYGDWSCTVFDLDTKKPIGSFCADAGLVSVFDLKEVLLYNPEYEVKENDHSATVVRNFKGTVQFVVVGKKGDFGVEVVGKGVDKETGASINFVSKQTGL